VEDEGFQALYEANLRELEPGTVVSASVVDVGPAGVVLDIGYKAEGVVPAEEFEADEIGRLKPGDEISVFIVRIDDAEGVVTLSRRRARRLEAWERIEAACRSGEPVEGTVTATVKGGLQVDVDGLRAFLPGSQVDLRNVRNLSEFVGLRAAFRVIRTDARRKNAILSRRAILEQEREALRRETTARLTKGALLEGRVKNVTDYGVFVDLGGIDGLLHVSDISWGRLKHPSERFSPGDPIEVLVLDYDASTEKVSLGYKQKTPDPWTLVEERFRPGDRVSGRVVGLTDYGAFVEVMEGVEGLVHISELRWGSRPRRAADVVSKGETVEAEVLRVSASERRLSLSVKRLLPNPWDTAGERYREGQIVRGTVKNITDFGAFVRLEEGIDGLVHVSDLSWTRHIRHPAELLRKGDAVEAVVLSVDPGRERMSLGIKQLGPDPWLAGIEQRFRVGRVYPGRVIRVVDFGVFIELEGGIEGLVHAAELGGSSGDRPDAERFPEGRELRVRVIRVDPGERKIALSLRDVEAAALPPAEEAPRGEGAGEDPEA